MTTTLLVALALFTAPQEPAQAATLSGRAVDAQGLPVTGNDLLIHAFSADGSHRSLLRVPVDDAGRFHLHLATDWDGRRVAALFAKTLDAKRAGWSLPAFPCTPGANKDLGTISLRPPARIATGQLEGLRPLAEDPTFWEYETLEQRQVLLWPEIALPHDGAEHWRWIDGGSEVHRDFSRSGGYAARAAMLRLTCSKNGAFELFGWPPPVPMRLRTISRFHLDRPPVPFAPGSKPIAIVVEPGGTVRTTLRIPRTLDPSRDLEHDLILARLVPTDSRSVLSLRPRGKLRDLSAFDRGAPLLLVPDENRPGSVRYEWPSLPAGDYRLELWCWGASRPFRTIADIRVRGRFVVQDKRLAVMDLRDVVRVATVRTVDAQGQPLAVAGAHLVSRSFPEGPVATPFAGSAAPLLLAGQPVDLEVLVPGHRPVQLSAVDGDRTVTLVSGPQCTLELAARTDLPEEALLEGALIEPGDGSPAPRLPPRLRGPFAPPVGNPVTFGTFTVARPTVRRAGPHRLLLWVRDARYGDREALADFELPVDVAADGSTRVEVALDPKAVDAALRSLGLKR